MSTTRYSTSRLSYNTMQPPTFNNDLNSNNNYSLYPNNDNFYSNSLARSRSPNLDAELKNVKKSGKDYHVTVNLNALMAANQINSSNNDNYSSLEAVRNQQTFNKKLIQQRETTNVVQRNYNDTLNNSNNNYSTLSSTNNSYNNPSFIGGARRTVVNLNGEDDANLYAFQQQKQQQETYYLSQQQQQRQPSPRLHLLTTTSPNYRSLSVSSSISPQIIQAPVVGNAYTVKSITSSDVLPKQNFINQTPRKDTVEFNLQLKGQPIQQVPPQIIAPPPTEWTVYGGVPIPQPSTQNQNFASSLPTKGYDDPFTARTNHRMIVEDDDDDDDEEEEDDDDEENTEEEDISLQPRSSVGKGVPKTFNETYKALYDMTKNNWWLNLEYGSAPQIRTESERQKTLPRETATESIDVILEKVKLELDNYIARANVEVRSERIIPINLFEKLFSVTAVIVTKNIEFDMNSSNEAMGLYENALAMERRSGGKLSNEDIKKIFVKMVEINKSILNNSPQNVKFDTFLTKNPDDYRHGIDAGGHDYASRKMAIGKNQMISEYDTRTKGFKNVQPRTSSNGYTKQNFQQRSKNSDGRFVEGSKKKSSVKTSQSKQQRYYDCD